MTQLSIREMVDSKVAKLRSVDSLSPQEIAQESIELSSLLSSVNVEIVDRRMEYNKKLKNLLEIHGSAPKSKIYAEALEEYRAVLEAEAYSKSLVEMIRTTKRATALAEQEMRESKY